MPRDPSIFGRVALVIGGDSAEREISLRGGRDVAAALEKLGVELSVVDGPRALLSAIAEGQVDTVFNLLHGRGGEDGSLQGALDLLGVPYTGSGLLASALAMDKLQTKRLWRACGLPTPDWRIADSPGDAKAILEHLEAPLFVKPVREGSSIGMARVLDNAALGGAIEQALACDESALVERMIDGPEFTASLLGDTCLPLIRISTPREFYDYQAKYEADDTQYHCPCGLGQAEEARLAALAMEAYAVLGGSGWGRVDFMLDQSGHPWLLEANTVPGMTDHSLVPMAARTAGLEFEELIWRILATSRKR